MARKRLPSKLHHLSVRELQTAPDGDHSDGGGLLLRCTANRHPGCCATPRRPGGGARRAWAQYIAAAQSKPAMPSLAAGMRPAGATAAAPSLGAHGN